MFCQEFPKWSVLGLLLEKFQPSFSSLIKGRTSPIVFFINQLWLHLTTS
ncbi:hypothetical protein TMUPMC115_1210 [Tetragenococcus muriaticus PMC-11-5]|uniref:Uncharacterized protein n=1 Tax=Tetragenococcus muriaticus PMC-11-5 TaxID=1302649 RepID=A0A091C1N6_9ENTE|nr:hypothetical protein TMUPMC115_1210 [Tetragenococcus muriaticus PMC-11-5]